MYYITTNKRGQPFHGDVKFKYTKVDIFYYGAYKIDIYKQKIICMAGQNVIIKITIDTYWACLLVFQLLHLERLYLVFLYLAINMQ